MRVISGAGVLRPGNDALFNDVLGDEQDGSGDGGGQEDRAEARIEAPGEQENE